MHQISPGYFHWSARHPRIGMIVHSYFVEPVGMVLDPILGEEGLDVLDGRRPERVVLTNRHHYRDAATFVEAFGVGVLVCEPGLHEVEGRPGVETFAFGDEVAPGVTAIEIDVICPDETALHVAHGPGALAVADGVMRDADGALCFVPDAYMGDDAPAIKAGLRDAYRRVAAERDFDLLLLAHGEPVVGGARELLRAFAESEAG
jgi:hypothetical protein